MLLLHADDLALEVLVELGSGFEVGAMVLIRRCLAHRVLAVLKRSLKDGLHACCLVAVLPAVWVLSSR